MWRHFLVVLLVGLWYVIVAFPDHTRCFFAHAHFCFVFSIGLQQADLTSQLERLNVFEFQSIF